MDKEQPTTTVNILDKEYRISCPVSQQDALIQAAHYLDHKMRTIRESGAAMGTEKIAVMAALNVANERLEIDLQNKSLENKTRQHTEKVEYLTTRLENALDQHV